MGIRRIVTAVALVAVLGAFIAPASAAEGPRGTGDASIRGLSLNAAFDATVDGVAEKDGVLKLDVIDLSSRATRDAQRAGEAFDLSRGRFAPARVTVEELTKDVPPAEVVASADNPSPDAVSPVTAPVELPGTFSSPELALDRTGPLELLNDLGGTEAPSVPEGALLSFGIDPDEISASFDQANTSSIGTAGIDDLSAMAGLVSVDNFRVGEQESWSEVDQAGSAIRAFAVDEATLLDLEGTLALFGVSFGDLTLDALAALADGLELPATATLETLGLNDDGGWNEAQEELDGAQEALEGAVDCDEVPGPIDSVLGEIGVTCDDVAGALADVNDLIDKLTLAVKGVLSGAPLLRVVDVKGEVQAVAAVDETGTAFMSATAVGSVGDVQVGGVSFGGVEVDLTKDPIDSIVPQLQALEDEAMTQINDVLSTLGPDYANLIDWQIVPVATAKPAIDGQYATALAELTLLKVAITLPTSLPDPVEEVVEGLTGGGDDDDSGSTTTTTLLPIPTTLPSVPLISSVRPVGEPRGLVSPLAGSITLEVGALSASADHTRNIAITSGGENRTFDRQTGFGDTPIPRTGGATGLVLFFAAVLVSAGWLGRRALVQAAERA